MWADGPPPMGARCERGPEGWRSSSHTARALGSCGQNFLGLTDWAARGPAAEGEDQQTDDGANSRKAEHGGDTTL